MQLRNQAQTISVVAGTQEYAVDPSVFKIHSAYYQSSSGSTPVPLIERSTDELDVTRWGWRNSSYTGDPIEYYITTAAITAGGGDSLLSSSELVIGFLPIPATTSSGGYPVVTLYCTANEDLSGSETVPAILLDDNVYLYRMFEFWCKRILDFQQAEQWEMLAEKELDRNHEHIQNIQSQGTSGFIMTSAFMPTRVV
jgi:hypothetical protein